MNKIVTMNSKAISTHVSAIPYKCKVENKTKNFNQFKISDNMT